MAEQLYKRHFHDLFNDFGKEEVSRHLHFEGQRIVARLLFGNGAALGQGER